ncbi:MAG TPA: S-methyl-5'-thioadenosine phosphorylase [Ilumatobacteraceae bacterium]|nr:S-methyl-5'-thioadenosine phosphorylase [Ilumatobacteraceae bacterium]
MSIELQPVGVIGGSGFYELLSDAQEMVVETPYGLPAAPVTVGTLSGRQVAFLPRHGVDHQFAAHRVPYRANIWALHTLGVRSIIAPCSVGSLQPDIHPGQMVVIDQLVDRTHGRADTYHDVGGPIEEPGSMPPVHHQTFADPYDTDLRAAMVRAATAAGIDVLDGGTMVVINGPRFSTRAESRWFAQMGWQVVNMTGYPEAVLAAELGIRYASVALVTDYDAGNDLASAVTMDDVFAMIRANVARVRELIAATLTDPWWTSLR